MNTTILSTISTISSITMHDYIFLNIHKLYLQIPKNTNKIIK